MTIDPISNKEYAASVRAKLNATIELAQANEEAAAVAISFGSPSYTSAAALVADINLTNGRTAYLNGEAGVVDTSSPYTANGDTVRTLTGISGQWVSLRTEFDSTTDLDADTRGYDALPEGTRVTTKDGLIFDVVAATATDYDRANAAGVRFDTALNAKTEQETGTCVFNDYKYIPDAQLAYIRSNDTDSQDEDIVTAALQAMHQAGMDYVTAGGSGETRIAVFKYAGSYAINDEIFTEDFAQDLWDLPQTVNKFVFEGNGLANFVVKNWSAVARARTSGLYDYASITDVVPTAVFRWEQKAFVSTGPNMRNIRITGSYTDADPIGIKTMRVNKLSWQDVTVYKLKNIGKMHEGIVNSDEWNTTVEGCGYQPTVYGGTTGFIPSTARFSATASGGTTLVACDEAIFDASHVGKKLSIAGAGANGNIFSNYITTVTDASNVVTSSACQTNVTDAVASFGTVLYSSTASSTTVTGIQLPTGTSLVGRYVFLYGAGHSQVADLDVHVTRVTAQSGNTLTLATAPRNTVSAQPLIIAPSEYVGITDDYMLGPSGNSTPNDCQVWGQRNENPDYSGAVGSAVNAIFQQMRNVTYNSGKSHGMSPNYNNFASNFANTIFDSCWNFSMPNYQFEWGHFSGGTYGAMVVCGKRNSINLLNIQIGNDRADQAAAHFYIDPQAAGNEFCKVSLSGLDTSKKGWPNTYQVLARYGANGTSDMLAQSGVWALEDTAFDDHEDILTSNLGDIVARGQVGIGGPASTVADQSLTFTQTGAYTPIKMKSSVGYDWAIRMTGGGDFFLGRSVTDGAFTYPVSVYHTAPGNSLVVNTDYVQIRKPRLTDLTSYASNADAISGGLSAGDTYTVTGTDPRQTAVVY